MLGEALVFSILIAALQGADFLRGQDLGALTMQTMAKLQKIRSALELDIPTTLNENGQTMHPQLPLEDGESARTRLPLLPPQAVAGSLAQMAVLKDVDHHRATGFVSSTSETQMLRHHTAQTQKKEVISDTHGHTDMHMTWPRPEVASTISVHEADVKAMTGTREKEQAAVASSGVRTTASGDSYKACLHPNAWALALEVNGASDAFLYDKEVWVNDLQIDDGMNKKTAAFFENTTDLHVSFEHAGATKSFGYTLAAATSLSLIFKGGTQALTLANRSVWDGLIADAGMQPYCNLQGFNVRPTTNGWKKARLGLIMNQENDCNSPDSSLGIGLRQLSAGSENSCCITHGTPGNKKAIARVLIGTCTGAGGVQTSRNSIPSPPRPQHGRDTISNTDIVVFVKTTASDKGLRHIKDFWAPFLAGLSNVGIHAYVSIDATPENHQLNGMHNWSSIPQMGNFVYGEGCGGGTSSKDKSEHEAKIREHPLLQTVVQALEREAPSVCLHVVSEKDMVQAYPALVEAVTYSKQFYPHPVGWGYNYISSLMLWRQCNEMRKSAKFVWEFQDDTRFSSSPCSPDCNNDISALVQILQSDRSKATDLLLTEAPESTSTGWMWERAASKMFEAAFAEHGPCKQRIKSSVRATRTSAKLMDLMHRWCGLEGKCAWNEMFPQSVASCAGLEVSLINRSKLIIQGGGNVGADYSSM